MSDYLPVPERLKGPWEHALVLTYGLDLPFFERSLWPQLDPRCRNRIILADGRRYLEACARYAESAVQRPPGEIRYLNRAYVAEGIFAPHAAHAKVILLASPVQGRLLVGSGNLGWLGYASGGEQFTEYTYRQDDSTDLRAFQAVREFLEVLCARGYVSETAQDRIALLLEGAPWLYSGEATAADRPPVVHTLSTGMLGHLRQVVKDEAVEELWIHAPFYDVDAAALRALLRAVRPARAHILVQPGHTSVDPTALQQAIADASETESFIRPFRLADDERLGVHAKFYLLKLANRAVCLQGSPNVSRVALLLADPHGNVEVANLLTGPRDAFDALLAPLVVSPPVPITDLGGLDLSLATDGPPGAEAGDTWPVVLRGGILRGDRLEVHARDPLPGLTGASLQVADLALALDVVRHEDRLLELRLPPEALPLFERPVPVRLCWRSGDGTGADTLESNPIFACDQQALQDVLEAAGTGETLAHAGTLDIEDADEIERFFAEMTEGLVLDDGSIWRLAGRPEATPSTGDMGDDAGPHLAYEDVDYEALRRHPKFQQCLQGLSGHGGQRRTRLQQILGAITDHFQSLVDAPAQAERQQQALAALSAVKAESEDEAEDLERVREERRELTVAQRQRIRRVVTNFLRRFPAGLRSPRYQQLVGPSVIGHNYAVFAHLLLHLLTKDWLEPEAVVDALVEAWRLFWGDTTQQGYFRILSAEQRGLVLADLRVLHADAEMLVGAHLILDVAGRDAGWHDRLFQAREVMRVLLMEPPFPLSRALLEEMVLLARDLRPTTPPTGEALVEGLTALISFTTPTRTLRELERGAGAPRGAFRFERNRIHVAGTNDGIEDVDCLVVPPNYGRSDAAALVLLREWMTRDLRPYYRLMIGSETWGFYDTRDGAGRYRPRDPDVPRGTLSALAAAEQPWHVSLAALRAAAYAVDAAVVLDVAYAQGDSGLAGPSVQGMQPIA